MAVAGVEADQQGAVLKQNRRFPAHELPETQKLGLVGTSPHQDAAAVLGFRRRFASGDYLHGGRASFVSGAAIRCQQKHNTDTGYTGDKVGATMHYLKQQLPRIAHSTPYVLARDLRQHLENKVFHAIHAKVTGEPNG